MGSGKQRVDGKARKDNARKKGEKKTCGGRKKKEPNGRGEDEEDEKLNPRVVGGCVNITFRERTIWLREGVSL